MPTLVASEGQVQGIHERRLQVHIVQAETTCSSQTRFKPNPGLLGELQMVTWKGISDHRAALAMSHWVVGTEVCLWTPIQ